MTPLRIMDRVDRQVARLLNSQLPLLKLGDRAFQRVFGRLNLPPAVGVLYAPVLLRPEVKRVDVQVLLSATDETAVPMGSNGADITPTPAPVPSTPAKPITREQAQKALNRFLRRPSLSSKITTAAKIALGTIGIYGFIELGTALGSKFLPLGASLPSIYLLGAVLSAAPFILFSIGVRVVNHFTFPLRRELKDPNSRAAYAVAQLAVEQGVVGKKGISPNSRAVRDVRGDIAAIDEICARYENDVRPPAVYVREGKEDLAALRAIVARATIETTGITKANEHIAELERKIPQIEAHLKKQQTAAPAGATAAAGGTPLPKPLPTREVGDNEYFDHGLIGEGLSAKVYKVADGDGNIFALKVFDPNVESITRSHARELFTKKAVQKDIDNLRKRFVEREIATIRELNEAGVPYVVLLDYAVDKGPQPAMVLSFGHQSLRELLTKNPTGIKQDLAVEITRQVCTALQQAFTLEDPTMLDTEGEPVRIIHRDLKPTNIMINDFEATGEGVEVMLVDFGAAKPLNQETALARESASVHTTLGKVYSTPGYIAPVVVEMEGSGELTDASADMFAVGIIFHELLTGKSPLEGLISTEAQLTKAGAKRTRELIPTLAMDTLAPAVAKIIRELLEGKHPDYQPIIDQLVTYAEVLEKGGTTPPPGPATRAPKPDEQGKIRGGTTQFLTMVREGDVDLTTDDNRALRRLYSDTRETFEACVVEIIDMADHMRFSAEEKGAVRAVLERSRSRYPELNDRITDVIAMLDEY